MFQIVSALSIINGGIVIGLVLLTLLLVGDLVSGFQLSERERLIKRIFVILLTTTGAFDRLAVIELTNIAYNEEALGPWGVIATLARLGFGVVVWTFVLYVLIFIWRKRLR